MPILLKNQPSDALHASLAPQGITLPTARRLLAAAVRRGEYPIPGSGFSSALIGQLRALTAIPHLALQNKVTSPSDGFTKYLFRGEGEKPFETVRIPLLHRPEDPKYVVCVSSQVGCALGCAFCATGRMGFLRNLAPWEIVDQVIQVQKDSSHPVRGVVFMGMGEPFLNYDAVMTAVRILSEPCGMAISAKAITVSTVGIIPGIQRFTAEKQAARLVVSLTSANPAMRRELLPVEKAHPTLDLMMALREYHEATGERVTLAWTMISGVNTGEKDAIELALLTEGLPVKLNLIDVNDPTGRYSPPSEAELNHFRDALRRHLHMPVSRRYSGGQDIRAACGMLAGR